MLIIYYQIYNIFTYMNYTPAKRYTEEQKQIAIRLANEIGWVDAAKQLSINKSTVRKWIDPDWCMLKKRMAMDDYHKNKLSLNARNLELRKFKKINMQGYKESVNKRERDRYNNNPETKIKQLTRCAEYRKETFKTINPKKKIYNSTDRKVALDLINKIGIKDTSKQLGITLGALKRWSDPSYAIKWKAYIKARYDANPAQHTEQCVIRHKERLKNDPVYKMRGALRYRIKRFVKHCGGNIDITRHEIGCSWEEFKSHIESKFTKEMNWDNHGIIWDIDHIKPLVAFGDKILTRAGQLEATHYTNLRPLCCIKNRQLNGVYNQLLAEGLNWTQIATHPLVVNA